ncbi:hypothetical protein DPMN_070022 [Dreissena polymorpha]|uniref:Uncharacterized protein n=1 Tax=Dreissena polymorpha TaxID=45954 RepID=A0A9D4BX45_DREPO|nr:hypothetical protein DPMN_070022 [Dreissena polymorpha]
MEPQAVKDIYIHYNRSQNRFHAAMVSTQCSKPRDPSSNLGGTLMFYQDIFISTYHFQYCKCACEAMDQRFHGVMVSTQDSESCDLSSNLGATIMFYQDLLIST